MNDADQYFMRPYLLKRMCYQHEREVRIVIPRDSDDPDRRRLLSIDARSLIEEVRISPHIPRSEAFEIRRSLAQAWRYSDRWDENDDDPGIFVSDAKTIYDAAADWLNDHQIKSTGIGNFGSLRMPFVMCGDFRAS